MLLQMSFCPCIDAAIFYAQFNSLLFLEEVGRVAGLLETITSPILYQFYNSLIETSNFCKSRLLPRCLNALK